MLSMQNVSDPGYYTRGEDYYAKDKAESKAASTWFGQGAAQVGLEGQVDPGDFKGVMSGQVPGGPKLGTMREGQLEHRPGTDLTFSAPKSVSIMALVAGDRRLIDAHTEAVKATLAYAESHILQTRIRDKQLVNQVGSQKMVAALFQQDTSRNLDPDLHTHSVIANMVLGEDGKWRSVDNSSLYDHKMALGRFYRGELAVRLEKMGYVVEQTREDGLFEIQGVSREVIEAMSTRAQEIREALAGYNFQNAKTAENAALMTRQTKKEIGTADLKAEWIARCKEHGLDIAATRLPEPHTDARGLGYADNPWTTSSFSTFVERIGKFWDSIFAPRVPSPGTLRDAEGAIRFAIDHLSEREAAFKGVDLVDAAIKHSFGRFSPTELASTIDKLADAGELIRATTHFTRYRGTYTTGKGIGIERDIIALFHAGQSTVEPILAEAPAKDAFKASTLRKDQQRAAVSLVSSNDYFNYLQGFAGVGKTRMYADVKILLDKTGAENPINQYKIEGRAPTNAAARVLQDQAGFPAATIQSFLVQNDWVLRPDADADRLEQARADNAKTILLVDEAGMLGNTQKRDTMKIAKSLGYSRVIFSGDELQLGAVEAGKPFSKVLDKNHNAVRMTDILRQQNSPDLREAVYAAANRDIEKAFEKIGPNNIFECDYKTTFSPAAEAALHWARLEPAERDRTLIITQNKNQRATANETVVSTLRAAGEIQGNQHQQRTLVPKDLTTAEMSHARYYDVGDQLIFTRSNKAFKIRAGAEYRVAAVDKKNNRLVLEHGRSKLKFQPLAFVQKKHHGLSVYEPGKIDLQAGAKITWTFTDKSKGIEKSQSANVESVKNGEITLKMADGNSAVFKADDPALRFMDYAYARTANSAQGMTFYNALGVFSGTAKFTTNQRNFYVTISRAVNNTKLFVYDVKQTIAKLKELSGAKLSALEAVNNPKAASIEKSEHHEQRRRDDLQAFDVTSTTPPAPVLEREH